MKLVYKILFVSILSASLVIHFKNRNLHFQECDSTQIFSILKNYPKTTASFIYNNKSLSNILKINKVNELIFTNEFILSSLRNKDSTKYLEISKNLNLLQIARLSLIYALEWFPYSFGRTILAIPMSSTYSIGPGLIYSIIYTYTPDFESFLSDALSINIALFHFSALLLYLIFRKLKINDEVALLFTCLYLFSINLYSYSYHLGSTIWNTCSVIIWLYFYTQNNKNSKKIGLVSLICFLFSYISILLYMGYLLSEGKNYSFNKKYLLIYLCVLIFLFPFGQTMPAWNHLADFYQTFISIPINLFSIIYKKGFVLNLILSWLILIMFFLFFTLNQLKNHRYLIYFIFVYLLLITIQFLPFTSTRHILFLSPIILFYACITFQSLYKNNKWVVMMLTFFLIGSGFYNLNIYQKNTISLDILNEIQQLKMKADAITINGCSPHFLYKFGSEAYQINNKELINSNTKKEFELHKKYLYVSQTIPFIIFSDEFTRNHKNFYLNKINSGYSKKTDNFFIYLDGDRNQFNIPNNIYAQLYELKSK